MGENLEEKVAELSVCCESCTNRLDKLEKRLAQCVTWIENWTRDNVKDSYAYATGLTGTRLSQKVEESVKAIFPD